MDNSIGKTNAHALSPLAPAPSVVSPPPAPTAVLQGNLFPLNELPRELKAYIAKLAEPETNKVLRLTNRSFRQAGAESVTKLTIPAQDINNLTRVLASLPAVTDVTITGLKDNPGAHLAEMAELDPAICSKIHQLDLSESRVTGASLAHLQSLSQLQSLDLSRCKNLTDADLAHLEPLTRLQSLNLDHCRNLTDDGLAHLKPLTQLLSLNLSMCKKLTNVGLANVRTLIRLQSLKLFNCDNITDDGLAHLRPLTQLQSLSLSYCDNVTDAGLAHLQPLTQLQSLNLRMCQRIGDGVLAHLQPLTHLQSLNLRGSGCYNIRNAVLHHFPFARF